MYDYGSLQYRRIVFALALGSFLVFSNLYLFQPMLPDLAHRYAISETRVNWIFAAATLGLSLGLVPVALLSESLGRRPVMLTGLIAIPLISLLMLFGHSFWWLVICRGILGLALAAFASIAVAYMAEELSSSGFSRAIGGYIAANSLGGISGRIAGGLLSDAYSIDTALLIVLLVTLAGVCCVVLLLPAQQHFSPQKVSLRTHTQALINHLRQRRVAFAMLIGGVNFALFVNLYSVMGFRLVAAPHYIPTGIASLIFLCYLGGTLSSRLSGLWLKRHGAINGMLMGSMISFAGMWIALPDHIWSMLLGLVCISFGAFFTHTLAYGWVGQKATGAKATATALYLVHYYIGGSLGGFLLLYCWQHNAWLGVTFGACALYALLIACVLRLRRYENNYRRDQNIAPASVT